MSQLVERLSAILDSAQILTGSSIPADYSHDEAIGVEPVMPAVVVRPKSTTEVASIVALANDLGIPITPRGNGTGLSGAAVPDSDSIVMVFELMAAILEIDEANHVVVVQPGLSLADLDKALAPYGLIYPILPGEESASLGGNVATNAGGMRAVKYGVTRNQVLGLQLVLATGDVIRVGGKFVKATTGYDIAQLVVGSEGTLAITTEITLKVVPRLEHKATLLAPFRSVDAITSAVPTVLGGGVIPLMMEYMDAVALSTASDTAGLDLGIPDQIKDEASAYMLVVLESESAVRLDEDVQAVATMLGELDAMDVYVLPPAAGTAVLEARENAFWMVKQLGVNDIVDVVVPRASVPEYLATVAGIATKYEAWIPGAGHVGDGNVHMSVFQPDEAKRKSVMTEIFAAGMQLGGVISAEHGIGLAKKPYLAELEDPAKIDLMRRIKHAFDPSNILNPGKVFG